jgi:hypothetical protein
MRISWTILRYYPNIRTEGPRKLMKSLIQIVSSPGSYAIHIWYLLYASLEWCSCTGLPQLIGRRKIVYISDKDARKKLFQCKLTSMFGGSVVRAAWRILKLWMVETASIYGGSLRIY